MAAPSYTHDLTDWIADSDTTAWGELTGAIAGGAPDEADTESALQGTNTASQSTSTTSLFSMCRILGSPVTLSSGQVALVWHGHGVATALLSYASGGLQVAFASSLANWKAYAVGGNDVPPFPYGKWVNNAVDPTVTADYTGGTPPTGGTSIYGIGSMGQLSAAVAKGQPHVCDIIRYGRAEARFNGGDVSNGYATFAGFAALNDAQTARWGLIQVTDGGYLWKGLMTLGYSSAVDFRDSNKTVFVQDTRKVSSSFNKIEVRQSTSRVDWTGITITCLSPSTTASKGAFEVIDSAADVNIEGSTFVDLDTFIFGSGSTVVDTTFRRCGQITQGGGSFSGCLITNSTAAVSMVVSDLSQVTGNIFISDGGNHAVNLGTISSTQTVSWNNSLTGYASSDGSTGNEAVLVSVSSGITLTINVASGADTPSVYNTGSGSVSVVSGQVTTTITVKDGSVSPPTTITDQSVNVYIEASSGGPLSEGTQILKSFTNSSGQVSDTRSLASSQPITGWARRASSAAGALPSGTTYFKETKITGTIDSATGFSATVLLQPDE